MFHHVRSIAACLALFATTAFPLSAQYAARVVVTGGTHAGTYDMHRPSCSIAAPSTITLIDSTARAQPNGLLGVVLSPSTFSLEFGRDSALRVTPAGFPGKDASHVRGAGALTLTWVYRDVTFTGTFSGMTIEGSDTVRVAATIACKGVKRN